MTYSNFDDHLDVVAPPPSTCIALELADADAEDGVGSALCSL